MAIGTPSSERPEIGLRAMTAADLAAASTLSKALSWPHRLEDWEFMLSIGAGLVATLADGEVIGTIMWWRYDERQAAIGMVIVANAWQGHGIGRALFGATRRELPGFALRLNSTPAGQPLYERFGFVPTGIIEQHQGIGTSAPIVPLVDGTRLRPVGRQDAAQIQGLDRSVVGLDRTALLDELIEQAKGIVIDGEKGILAFSFCRKFGWGWLIGPVVAPSLDEARALIAHWIGAHGGEFVRLDIPATCGLSDWLDDMGLIRVDTVNTMATESRDMKDGALQYFALASQALG